MNCPHNKDEEERCAAFVTRRGKRVCDVFDELIEELKQCPLDERKE